MLNGVVPSYQLVAADLLQYCLRPARKWEWLEIFNADFSSKYSVIGDDLLEHGGCN